MNIIWEGSRNHKVYSGLLKKSNIQYYSYQIGPNCIYNKTVVKMYVTLSHSDKSGACMSQETVHPPAVTSYVCLTCIMNIQPHPVFPALQIDTPWHNLQSQATRHRLNIALMRKTDNNASNTVRYSFSTSCMLGNCMAEIKSRGQNWKCLGV